MKAKGKFISFLLVVDTFFAAYAYGFHCRHVLIIDPKMSPSVKPVLEQAAIPAATKKSSVKAVVLKTDSAQAKGAKKSAKNKSAKRL